jgi:polysaccharide pyruvyl transferase CsaB
MICRKGVMTIKPNEPTSTGPRVFLGGYYGFNNTGDEAILQAVLTSIRQKSSGIQFVVVSGNPDYTMHIFGVSSVHWLDINGIINEISKCDLVIIGGGGLFCDYWGDIETLLTRQGRGISYYSNFAIIAHLLGKPFITYAVGIGPLYTEGGRQITRFSLNYAEKIIVRDLRSAQEAIQIGLPEDKIVIAADPVFLLEPDIEEGLKVLRDNGIPNSKDPVLLISVRTWDIGIEEERWQHELVAAVDDWLEKNQGYVVFMPFQVLPDDGHQDDTAISEFIIQKLNRKDRVVLLPGGLSPNVMAGIFANCNIVLGMRYHAVLFSALAKTPVLAVSYDPKVESLMLSLDMSEYSIPLVQASKENIVSTLQTIVSHRSSISSKLQSRVIDLVSRAKVSTDIVMQILESDLQSLIDQQSENSRFKDLLLIKQTRLLNDEAIQTEQLILSHRELKSSNEELKFLNENLESSIEKLKSSYEELDNLYIALKDRHSRLQGDMAIILNSRTFKLAQKMAFVSGKIFPVGGRARRTVSLTLNVYRAFRKDGIQGVKVLLTGPVKIKTPEHVLRDQLSKTLQKYHNSPVVIYPPNIDWNIPIFQRPQQMALAYARQGCLVIFCEPRFTPIKELEQVSSCVYVYQGPLELLKVINGPILVVFTYNAHYAKDFTNPHVVYEYIDDLDVFPYDQEKLQREHLIWCKEADVVVATARNLHDHVSPFRSDVLLNPNAVDYDHYKLTRQNHRKIPEELQSIVETGAPLFGYFGSLARWFDYDLLKDVARLRPNYHFILIGPDYDGTIKLSGILDVPHIHWLGPKPYQNLPNYLALFSAAMIPFVLNDITHATSPLKLFEYMAGHKPVVITPMEESMFTPGVLVGKTPREFAERLDESLQLQSSKKYIDLLDSVARENTWDARVKQILGAISEKKAGIQKE